MPTESGITVNVQLNSGALIRLTNVCLVGRYINGTTTTGKEIMIHDDIKMTTQI